MAMVAAVLTPYAAPSRVQTFAQVYVALIAFFNYYYTFLQLEPKDLADSLKRQARLQFHKPPTVLLLPSPRQCDQQVFYAHLHVGELMPQRKSRCVALARWGSPQERLQES